MTEHSLCCPEGMDDSSVQSLDRSSCRGDRRDDSGEILFQSFPQNALMSSSDMDSDVHPLTLSIQHFLCRPRRRPPAKVPTTASPTRQGTNHGVAHPPRCRPRRRPPAKVPITTSPTRQGALKDGFGEAVVACDMPETCKIPSLDSCQKRFLWIYREVDLAPHPVVGLVVQVGDAEKLRQAFGFERLEPFFQSQLAGSMFHNHRGGWR